MRELDVGDVVYHKITNQVFWVSGNYHVGRRESMLLNIDCVWCINDLTPGGGLLIPRSNLSPLPFPKHIDSNVVYNLSALNDLIDLVSATMNKENDREVSSFINKAIKVAGNRNNWNDLIDRKVIVYKVID